MPTGFAASSPGRHTNTFSTSGSRLNTPPGTVRLSCQRATLGTTLLTTKLVFPRAPKRAFDRVRLPCSPSWSGALPQSGAAAATEWPALRHALASQLLTGKLSFNRTLATDPARASVCATTSSFRGQEGRRAGGQEGRKSDGLVEFDLETADGGWVSGRR